MLLCALPAQAVVYTQQEALQVCLDDANYRYNVNLASHGAQYVHPGFCEHVSAGIAGYWNYLSVVEVDIYHSGNFIRTVTSPSGYAESTYDPLKECHQCLDVGNPIHLPSGVKRQTETDLIGATAADLSFVRTYLGDKITRPPGQFGARWRSQYDRRLQVVLASRPNLVIAFRQDGRGLYYRDDGTGLFTFDSDMPFKLERQSSGGTTTGWTLTDTQDRVETYDAEGRLLQVRWPDGNDQQLAYNAAWQLTSVTARDGRQLSFAYDGNGRLQTMTAPDGAVTHYAYDATSGLLSAVTYPDGASRQYFYNEAGYVISPPTGVYHLTGVQDEDGQRYASFGYDSSQRGILSTHAGNADRVDIAYTSSGSASVTDALGRTTSRTWQVSQRTAKLTGTSGISSGTAVLMAAANYDSLGFRNVTTDFRGTQTDHDYDARGLETQRIEASNDTTGNKRTIQTDWDPVYRSPLERRIRDAAGTLKAKTAWTRNGRGQVLTQTETDPSLTPNATRTTTYGYCEQADVAAGTCPFVGLLKSIDGARTDLADTTTYVYRQNDEASCAASAATCPYRKGDLWKTTNAAGHVSEVLRNDGAGRPLSIKDPNDVVTDLEYDARGRLTARKLRGADDAVETDDQITRIEYWPPAW